MMKWLKFKISWALLITACLISTAAAVELTSKHYALQANTLIEGLEHPWSLAFLPDGGMLITERPGRLRRVDANGQLLEEPIKGLPTIMARGQGGLLDVVLHPNFAENAWVYFSYVRGNMLGWGTEVARGQLEGQRLTHVETLFRMLPKKRGGRHFGSRLVFDRKGHLYITLGDRGVRIEAQNLRSHLGTVVRLTDEGSIPEDNPFINRKDALPEIYSYGNRNVQGAALHPVTGELWAHEHGPQGGDELNLIQGGVNYGWPVITFGANYGIGTKIGEGTAKAGMAQPLYQWTPSIAPSGMAFYQGEKFKQWQGNLFVGSLKFQTLVRLELQDNQVVSEEPLLEKQLGRIRDVRVGPDGWLYLLIDAAKGSLVRLELASTQ